MASEATAAPRPPSLRQRSSGLLAHITSLPGPARAGDLGTSAGRFLEFLRRAGQSWWQMLPVGPPGYGGSPYSAESAFAGSPAMVALEPLVLAGLLPQTPLNGDADRREAALRRAFDAFMRADASGPRELARFRKKNAHWLDDYTLFHALKRAHGNTAWFTWPIALRRREPRALAEARKDLEPELDFAAFLQCVFATQWASMRAKAAELGIGLIGDVPLYVAHDSADVWSHPRLFRLDDDGMPTVVAGVPPDYFSATGQLWGNPLYAWERHRKTGFRWWTRRFQSALERFDALRLDHFIGFTRYWEIDGKASTAEGGHWREGPGTALFEAASRQLRTGGRLPFIAEDLGVVGDDVRALRDAWKLPGTKVLQFAFGDDPSAESFLPHTYRRRSVVYTGTHDNDTVVGWFNAAPSEMRPGELVAREQAAALRYLGVTSAAEIHWSFIRTASASVADLAIFPLQDVLGLDSRARMNLPGTTDAANWTWRAEGSSLSARTAQRLAELARTYGRAPHPT